MNQTITIGPVAHGETITLVCGQATTPPSGGTTPPVDPPTQPPVQPPATGNQTAFEQPWGDSTVRVLPLQVGQELAIGMTVGNKGGMAAIVGRTQSSAPGKYRSATQPGTSIPLASLRSRMAQVRSMRNS
jgi:hypothetical protein